MTGDTYFLEDHFSYFLSAMFKVPSVLIRSNSGTALLVFFLILAIAVVFLWDRWLKKAILDLPPAPCVHSWS